MSDTSITMSSTQLQRFEVLSQLNNKTMNGTEASEKLGLSVRHIRRLKKCVKKNGARGLLHGNTGTVSPQKIPKKTCEKIKVLLTGSYKDFGPTFASEKLLERNQIDVSHEWLRLFMMRESLWRVKERRERVVHREWRPRMAHLGSMEQFDGSYHHWIPGVDEEQCLLLSIDDATGTITKAHFDYHEGIVPVFTFWKEYAEMHNRLPTRLYVDKFSTYKVNHKNAVDNPTMITQFERALKELGVDLIRAHSPQAKGRVERVFGTLQDRLVKEMGLAGVKTITEANDFLVTYIPRFNAQFGVKAVKEGDAYVPMLATTDMARVFSTHEERCVSNDFCVRFENEWYQIEKEQSSTVLPRDTVIMEKRLDGSVAMRLMRTDRYLKILRLPMRPVRATPVRIIPATTRVPYVPASNHPWRQYPRTLLREVRETVVSHY